MASTDSSHLDEELDSIIKKNKQAQRKNQGGKKQGAKQDTKNQGNRNQGAKNQGNRNQGRNQGDRAQGNNITKRLGPKNNRTPIKNTARNTRQRDTSRASRDARSQTINKARGIQSQTTRTKTVVRRRPTVAATSRANTIKRNALMRSHRQPVNRRNNQNTQTPRANTGSAVQAKNLRITVTNRVSRQGTARGGNAGTRGGNAGIRGGNAGIRGGNAGTRGGNAGTRGGSVISNKLRNSGRLRTRVTLVGSPARLRLNQRGSAPRVNLRRAPVQNIQRQQPNQRLTRVRQSNQARQANVVAQRRGIRQQSNNNSNSYGNGRGAPARNTLDARFSQARRGNQGGGNNNNTRRVVSAGSQGNNRGRNQRTNNNNNNRSRQYW